MESTTPIGSTVNTEIEIVVFATFGTYSGLRAFPTIGDALRFAADFAGIVTFEQIQSRYPLPG